MKAILKNVQWNKGFHYLPHTFTVTVEDGLTGEELYVAALEAADVLFEIHPEMDEDDMDDQPTSLDADVSSVEDEIDILEHAIQRALDSELFHIVDALELELIALHKLL
jgi:hypothetical protein